MHGKSVSDFFIFPNRGIWQTAARIPILPCKVLLWRIICFDSYGTQCYVFKQKGPKCVILKQKIPLERESFLVCCII